ncbi:MAG: hypothetical protein GH151_00720 [Bacteroidetes bacterium]|nr:hypothetical protein [Bacteroidota bacterium]
MKNYLHVPSFILMTTILLPLWLIMHTSCTTRQSNTKQSRDLSTTQPSMILAFESGFLSSELDRVSTQNAKLTFDREFAHSGFPGGYVSVLRVTTGYDADRPIGITINAHGHPWDLSRYERITIPVKNIDSKPVIIGEFHFGALYHSLFHTGLRPRLPVRKTAPEHTVITLAVR